MKDATEFEYGVIDNTNELIALFTDEETCKEFARSKPEYGAVVVYRRWHTNVTFERARDLLYVNATPIRP